MEAGTHSIWISEQLKEMGHDVIVANVRELRAISHSDRKSDQVDAEKLARYARLDPEILRTIAQWRATCIATNNRKSKNSYEGKDKDQTLTAVTCS